MVASKTTTFNIKQRSVIALAIIALMITLSYSLTAFMLAKQDDDAKTINIAGKQRMLSQKIALLSNQIIYRHQQDDHNNSHQALKAAISEFESNHMFLLKKPNMQQGEHLSSTLIKMYLDGNPSLHQKVLIYIQQASEIANTSDFSAASPIDLKTAGALLAQLHAIVGQYEIEAKSKVEQLADIQLSIWIVSILVLWLVWILVFGRAQKLIESNLKALKAEKEKALYLQKLSEGADKAKSKFLARMSHELRTPMNGIFGMLDLAKDNENKEQREHCLEVAERSGKQLSNLINDILDVSKIDRQEMRIEPHIFQFSDFVEAELIKAEALCKSQGLKFTTEVRASLPKLVNGDSKKLEKVIQSLISNAVKFTPKGLIHISINMVQTEFHFSVIDTGIGMEQSQIDAIFQPFFQVDETVARQFDGAGLGLPISKTIVDLFGGELKVNSKLGKGSEFSVRFCLDIVGQTETENVVDKCDDKSFDGNQKRILLVEDNEVNALVTTTMLKKFNYQVERAEDGQVAVDRLSEGERFALVLMDINMPNMDGYQATEYIRKELALDVPNCALTANSFPEDVENSISVGIGAHLAKTLDRDNLLKTIERLISLTEAYR